MTTAHKIGFAVAFCTLAGTACYERWATAEFNRAAATIGAETRQLDEENRSVAGTQHAAWTKLADVEKQIDARLATAKAWTPDELAMAEKMRASLARVDEIRAAFAAHPEWDIPELTLLDEATWFGTATAPVSNNPDVIRQVAANLRNRAVNSAEIQIRNALNAYLREHDNVLPANCAELMPYTDGGLTPEILARFRMLRSGKIDPADRVPVIDSNTAVDDELDQYWRIGPTEVQSMMMLTRHVQNAEQEFMKANGGQRPVSAVQLATYLPAGLNLASVQNVLNRRRPNPTP